MALIVAALALCGCTDEDAASGPIDVDHVSRLSSDELLDLCERLAADAAGELSAQAPESMAFDDTGTVTAALTLRALLPDANVLVSVTEEGVVPFEGTRCEIRATLTGAAFAIDPQGPQTRSLLGSIVDGKLSVDRPLQWSWTIRATNRGDDRPLYVTFEPIVVSRGRALPDHEVVLKREVDVGPARDLRSGPKKALDIAASLAKPGLPSIVVIWLGSRARRRIRRVRNVNPPQLVLGVRATDGATTGAEVHGGSTAPIVVGGHGDVPLDASSAAFHVTVLNAEIPGAWSLSPEGSDEQSDPCRFEAGSSPPTVQWCRLGPGGAVNIYSSATAELVVEVGGFRGGFDLGDRPRLSKLARKLAG